MSEEFMGMGEAEEVEQISSVKPKSRRPRKSKKAQEIDSKKRALKGIELAITRPSYNLQRGLGILTTDLKSLRGLHRNRLSGFLRKLMRRHNWDEVSGVLSVLLKSSCKDRSPSRNRTKYLAALELLKHTDSESNVQKNYQHVFDTWMRKLSISRGWQTKDRFLVQLEFILFCLTQGKTGDANQAVIWLMQEREFTDNPISNLVVGLAFCQDWYDTLCKEFPALDLSGFNAPNQSEMSEPALEMSFENPRTHVADEFQEDNYTVNYSDTSVRNDKEMECDEHKNLSINVDNHRETPHGFRRPQSFYVHSEESDELEEVTFSGHASILYVQGLEPWLLASRVLYSVKSLDEFIDLQKKVRNESYKAALKYFRAALNSTPPMLAALFPLVQMLLLGDKVKEAMDEVERFTCSDTALYARLKASLSEHFDSNNHIYLSTCFEDALKKDPACTHSLTRLLCLHRQGDYSAEKLLQMVALHLDATYAECDMWKEFASCFLKLSLSEEDRISTCVAGNGEILQGQSKTFNRNPVLVADSVMGKEWILRCRWWQTRHFSQSILMSEFEAGDMQLLTYKAASACHLYGRDFEYVRKVLDRLEKDKNNSDMFSFLQFHMQNSVGFYQKSKRNIY
ncbi:TAF RNA polymerase I subunit A [Heracleum sosnowskyi]|uniref:TAF RNA polymerase I subunit A n=1 Tax=Heracleum sosnowskyi TaxID=360622 RepID=A0AAD8MZD3_9APIA|nr:TAF RNA polymerase I subunit A [Heracleum sosnowskyi]